MRRQIGSARERAKGSGRWELRWYSKRDDKYYTKTVSARNETEARKLLGRVVAEFESCEDRKKPESLTVAEMLERFLTDYATQNLRRTTLQRYTAIIRNDIVPSLGSVQAERLSVVDISDYFSWALEHGRKDGSGGLSARTVHHIHSLLRKAYSLGVKRHWVSRNPTKDVDPPTPDNVEMQALAVDQLVELLELCRGTKYEMPITLGAFTGMRRGEILGLKWDCIDFERRTITIIRTLEEVKEGLFLGDTKTRSSRRTIPIADTLTAALTEHQNRQGEQKRYLGELYTDQDFVCAEEDGRPMRPKNLTTAFRQLADGMGLFGVRFHDLSRHTPATIMLENGENATVVQEHLGHANYGITMDIYSHVSVRMSREAAERYDRTVRDAKTKYDARRRKSVE